MASRSTSARAAVSVIWQLLLGGRGQRPRARALAAANSWSVRAPDSCRRARRSSSAMASAGGAAAEAPGWPADIRARGEVRHQYHHAVDIVPTILECCGVEFPDYVLGYE